MPGKAVFITGNTEQDSSLLAALRNNFGDLGHPFRDLPGYMRIEITADEDTDQYVAAVVLVGNPHAEEIRTKITNLPTSLDVTVADEVITLPVCYCQSNRLLID